MAALSEIDPVPATAARRLVVQPIPGEVDPQIETVTWSTTAPIWSEALRKVGWHPLTTELGSAISAARAKLGDLRPTGIGAMAIGSTFMVG